MHSYIPKENKNGTSVTKFNEVNGTFISVCVSLCQKVTDMSTKFSKLKGFS